MLDGKVLPHAPSTLKDAVLAAIGAEMKLEQIQLLPWTFNFYFDRDG